MEITVVKAVCVLFCLVLVVLVTGCGGGGTTTTMAPEPKAVKPVTFSTEVGYNSAKFADSIVFTLDNNTDVSRAVTLKSKTVESKETTVRIIDAAGFLSKAQSQINQEQPESGLALGLGIAGQVAGSVVNATKGMS